MILFVSDLHYDHRPDPGDPLLAEGHAAERDLVACLRHHRREVTSVVLLGDMFDAWIEYRDLVPKGLTRLLGLLALWADEGVRVIWAVGNHDPWHRDHARSLGFELTRGHTHDRVGEVRVIFGHGDADEHGRLSPWQRFIRSRTIHRLYAELLPGSLGQTVARLWSRTGRSSGVNAQAEAALEQRARRILADDAADAVVFGHTHRARIVHADGGVYANTGCWALERTYVTVDEHGVSLFRWDGTGGRPRAIEDPGKPEMA